MMDRPDFSTICDAAGNNLPVATPADAGVPAEHTQMLADMQNYGNTPATPATTTANVPAKRPGAFSNNPDWTDKPPRDEQGRFIAKASDAAIIQSNGFVPEVAEVLSAQGDLAGAVDSLRSTMVRAWGDDAATVAQWASELSPKLQAKCADVLLRNGHLSQTQLVRRIRQTLTLDEAAEIETWLNK